MSNLQKSKYKVGDIVWFIASASSPFKLFRETVLEDNKTIHHTPIYDISYKFSPIPICGEIKSIYVTSYQYQGEKDLMLTIGGRRVSGANGVQAVYDDLDEISYEIQICVPPGLFQTATNSYYNRFNHYALSRPTIMFFISGLVQTKAQFVANSPEEAELCFSEWQIDCQTRLQVIGNLDSKFSSWAPLRTREEQREKNMEAFNQGLLFAEISNKHDNFHKYLKNYAREKIHGKTISYHKYSWYLNP